MKKEYTEVMTENINMLIDKLYEEYHAECEEISLMCAEEGYPSHGSNYELRVQQIWDDFYAQDLKRLEEKLDELYL